MNPIYQLALIVVAAVTTVAVALGLLSIPIKALRALLFRRAGGAIVRLAREGASEGTSPALAYRDLEAALMEEGTLGGRAVVGDNRSKRLVRIRHATEQLRRYHPELSLHLDVIDRSVDERSFIDAGTASGLLEPLRRKFRRA